MKRLLIIAVLFFLSVSMVSAQSRGQKNRIEQIANAVASAFVTRDLGRLDQMGLLQSGGSVRIVVSHSLGEEGKDIVVRHFTSFYRAERWLSNRHPQPGLPNRVVQTFTGCRKGVCTFEEDGGILHNHLYLQEISYGYRNGRLFIKELYFYDGD